MHTAVTEHPTAPWLSRQVTEAFPWDSAPRYLLRDRDTSYGAEFLCWRTRRFHSFAMHSGFDPDNARQSGNYWTYACPNRPRLARKLTSKTNLRMQARRASDTFDTHVGRNDFPRPFSKLVGRSCHSLVSFGN